MSLDKYRHIVVEGPIGVGKTSLARKLAAHTGATTLFEKPEANPFLERFYLDPARYALPAQLSFLFQRVAEMKQMDQSGLFEISTVSDYLFAKDELFARLNLPDDEFLLYQQMFRHLSPQVPAPDLVIYLQATPETLIERVHRRAHPYERPISDSYLARLSQAYSDFFYHYDAAPVLVINSENLNFVDSPDDFVILLERIRQMRGAREYFNVG
ncbi:deoxynucleoside kinase [Ferriphaselus sp. R-1]|uniref:deoxynucleoside kinase n=1 Tax=Ferriphaselus sp. R-1 TaxID=1485544 RepID=UPI0005580D5E|nr:deoxynucleoside kinase [Ferriphaselus sp. R-1]